MKFKCSNKHVDGGAFCNNCANGRSDYTPFTISSESNDVYEIGWCDANISQYQELFVFDSSTRHSMAAFLRLVRYSPQTHKPAWSWILHLSKNDLSSFKQADISVGTLRESKVMVIHDALGIATILVAYYKIEGL